MGKSLRDLGYWFNQNDELRDEDGMSFKFTTQAEYEELGDAITEYIYDRMQKEYKLQRKPVRPVIDTNNHRRYDNFPDEHFGFVFVSPDWSKKETILVLIHGMGAVRAGQWGRKLIINECLDEGSQLPYIRNALQRDWGVVVLNTNHNSRIDENERKLSSTSEKHAENAWHLCVDETEAKTIHVVAHSAGGSGISGIMKKYEDTRVKSIILTDSWFTGPTVQAFVINFTASKPMNAFKQKRKDFWEIYAGTNEHDRTSAACIDAAFCAMDNWDANRTATFLVRIATLVRGGCQAAGWASEELNDANGENDENNKNNNENNEQGPSTAGGHTTPAERLARSFKSS
ncbi:unnamed protein product, partial [Mesorhabditis belari]|uniref:GPI inositol-deacylase n=1 Tax=Mesorhabditis belari TaxID=2138241 RepID=A0AAF3FEH0_9BILA